MPRPIAIKKCQDDQEFDITQSEILGNLFANAATIRVIQAPAIPGVRDSVPPTSALRFEPANHLGKRGRGGSARLNSSASWQPNKRQRVSDLDPDKPLLSREIDPTVRHTIYEEEEPRDEMIPDSQLEAAYVGNNGNSRHVRDVPRISETPSPPFEVPDSAHFECSSADCKGPKSNVPNTDDPIMSQTSVPNLFGPASVGTQNIARSKSTSYHIQRATERGTSVSTAATSPLSGDQQTSAMNGSRSPNKRKITHQIFEGPKINCKPNSRSENEDSIYENVPSDSERSAILSRTKDKLKIKSNSPSGLPGHEWAKKFNTPPNGSRRTLHSQERVISNGELPLTPNSKEREEGQRQKEQAEAGKARVAAAAAAEERKREADEARATEERERMRKIREKSDREAQEKRNAVIAKAARLEQERLEQIERAHREDEERQAEENCRERERIREETKQAEHLEREMRAQIAKERQEAERIEREKASEAEAGRVRSEEAERRTKETALAVEEMRKSREQSEQSKAPTPDRSKETPIRPQSSTPFIPSGRKSALKAPSSQAAASPSPALARTISAGSSNGSKNELDVPNEPKRRVSFDLKPIRPPILPPSRSSASKTAPTPKDPAPKQSIEAKKERSPKPADTASGKQSSLKLCIII